MNVLYVLAVAQRKDFRPMGGLGNDIIPVRLLGDGEKQDFEAQVTTKESV